MTATPATGWVFIGWSGDLIGSANSAQITIDGNKNVTATFAQLPVITGHPSDQSVTEGQTANFSVTATGSGLTYQWQKQPSGGSFVNIPGANGASYTTPATAFSDNGAKYHCVVTNGAGSVTSNDATLTVNVALPIITGHPSNQTVTEGQTATFTVIATGSGLSYQWQKQPSGGSFGNIPGCD